MVRARSNAPWAATSTNKGLASQTTATPVLRVLHMGL